MTRYFDLVPGYESLATVYDSAIEQASEGKGRERHAEAGEPYEKQIICEVARRVGLGYPLGQAVKKIYESQRIGGERGVAELLGALNYVAAAVIVMREGLDTAPKADEDQKFKPGDKVEFYEYNPNGNMWLLAEYIGRRNEVDRSWHAVKRLDSGEVALVHCGHLRKAEVKAEGVEGLVQKDAPQTPQELYDRILSVNPATFHTPSYAEEQLEHHSRLQAHKPTGEKLAEMAEEDA